VVQKNEQVKLKGKKPDAYVTQHEPCWRTNFGQIYGHIGTSDRVAEAVLVILLYLSFLGSQNCDFPGDGSPGKQWGLNADVVNCRIFLSVGCGLTGIRGP